MQNKLGSMLRAETYTYNALNRLTGLGVRRVDIQSASSAPVPLQGYAYTLNKNGHRSQIAELSGRTFHNTFDALHRLTSDTYDANGNTTSSQGVANSGSPSLLSPTSIRSITNLLLLRLSGQRSPSPESTSASLLIQISTQGRA